MHIYALVQNLVCLIPTLAANMSQLVKDRSKQLIDTAIVVTGTNKIVPAVVFHKLGRLSAYIEHYYLHTERLMVLIVEPITDPKHRFYIPQWRDELLENILLKLASTGLVAGDYYTYVHSFIDANLLRKLAFALEEGLTFDEEDSRSQHWHAILIFQHCLWRKDGKPFLCTISQRFQILNYKVNNLLYLIPNSKLLLHFTSFWYWMVLCFFVGGLVGC